MRALAIIGMVQVHFAYHLSGFYDRLSLEYRLSELIGSFPAPFFTFLVGMSFFLSINKQARAGTEEHCIFRRNLRRGVSIFFFGLIFAVAIWMPVEVFNWDILTLIGTSLIVLFPLRRLAPKWLLAIVVVIIVASPVLRVWSEYHRYWDGWGEYINPFTLRGIVLGFFLNAYFPLLPWLSFPIAGLATAKICFPHLEAISSPKTVSDGLASKSMPSRPSTAPSSSAAPPIPRCIPLCGSGLFLLSLIGMLSGGLYESSYPQLAGVLSEFTFYPASTTFLLMALGIILLSFWVFYRLFDQREVKEGAFLLFTRRYSKYALSAYIIHHAAHVWPILIASASKRDQWHYYGLAMPAAHSLLLSLLFVVLFYLILVVWDKKRSTYNFEGLLQRLTG